MTDDPQACTDAPLNKSIQNPSTSSQNWCRQKIDLQCQPHQRRCIDTVTKKIREWSDDRPLKTVTRDFLSQKPISDLLRLEKSKSVLLRLDRSQDEYEHTSTSSPFNRMTGSTVWIVEGISECLTAAWTWTSRNECKEQDVASTSSKIFFLFKKEENLSEPHDKSIGTSSLRSLSYPFRQERMPLSMDGARNWPMLRRGSFPLDPKPWDSLNCPTEPLEDTNACGMHVE